MVLCFENRVGVSGLSFGFHLCMSLEDKTPNMKRNKNILVANSSSWSGYKN